MARHASELLTASQSKAIALLAAGQTCAAVASELRIGERTLYRWRADPVFRIELDTQRRRIYEAVAGSVAAAAIDAVALLQRVVTDEDLSTSVRVTAAAKLIDAAMKGLNFDHQLHPITLTEVIARAQTIEPNPENFMQRLRDEYHANNE
jgi:hypothetical protein